MKLRRIDFETAETFNGFGSTAALDAGDSGRGTIALGYRAELAAVEISLPVALGETDPRFVGTFLVPIHRVRRMWPAEMQTSASLGAEKIAPILGPDGPPIHRGPGRPRKIESPTDAT